MEKRGQLEFIDGAALKILCAIITKQGTSEGEQALVDKAYGLALWLWAERTRRHEQLEKMDAATK